MDLKYETRFWQGLPIITANFEKKSRELNLMKYIFLEYSAIVNDYAKGIDRLSAIIYDYDKGATYGQGISAFLSLLKQESEIQLKRSDFILRARADFEKAINQSKRDMELIVKDFNSNENTYFNALRELESLCVQFHSVVRQVDIEKMAELAQTANPSLKIFSEEQISKITSSIQNSIDKAKEIQKTYVSTIASTNKVREVYISTANQLFRILQANDTGLLELFKKTLQLMADHNQKHYQELSECYLKCGGIQSIDPAKDIKAFIEKNKTKGYPPFELEFIAYSHQSEVLPVELCSMTVQEQEKCTESRLELLDMFKPDEADLRSDWPLIESLAKLSFEGQLQENDKKTLLKLFNKESNQRGYLNYLNQVRTKGHYIINDQAYASIGELINGILTNISANDVDKINYSLVQYCIIISQTYGKPAQNYSDEKILVQKEIMRHKIWKNKNVWRALIDNAIKAQLNNKNSHTDYCQGLTPDKNDVVDKSSFSNILTYADTLKSFCFPLDEIMDILRPLCREYNVDEQMVEEVSKRDETEEGQPVAGQRNSIKNMIESFRTSNTKEEQKTIEDMYTETKENGKSTEKKPREYDQAEDEEEPQPQIEAKEEMPKEEKEDQMPIENKAGDQID